MVTSCVVSSLFTGPGKTYSDGMSDLGQDTAPIKLTDRAIQMGKKKLAEAGEDKLGIRIGVKGGGCHGLSYHFDFADKVRPQRDVELEFDGLTLIVDKKSIEFLRGA